MRVLIIDGDSESTSSLKRGLEADRLAVDVVNLGQTGFEYSQTYGYDLIVLDPNVADVKCGCILRRIHTSDSGVPIVVITASCSLEEKIRCFELGADDYLVKPFLFAEFRARVHAVIRRAPRAAFDVLTVGSLTLDRLKQHAILDTRLIKVTPKEYLLLEYLMKNRNRAASRRKLLANGWGEGVRAKPGTVDAFIYQLRMKTEASSKPRIIHTVRGVGYVMQGCC